MKILLWLFLVIWIIPECVYMIITKEVSKLGFWLINKLYNGDGFKK